MTTAPHGNLRRRDFHPQVQQLASLRRFHGTIKALRRLPPFPPRFVSFVWWYPGSTHLFAPAVAACCNVGPGVGHPVSPPGNSSVELAGSPKFLGNPDSRLHMFFDPGRPVRP